MPTFKSFNLQMQFSKISLVLVCQPHMHMCITHYKYVHMIDMNSSFLWHQQHWDLTCTYPVVSPFSKVQIFPWTTYHAGMNNAYIWNPWSRDKGAWEHSHTYMLTINMCHNIKWLISTVCMLTIYLDSLIIQLAAVS